MISDCRQKVWTQIRLLLMEHSDLGPLFFAKLACKEDDTAGFFLIMEVKGKVSKGAKIRNPYNQAPHLTQDTNGKMTNSQLYTTNKSQEVSPLQSTNAQTSLGIRTV